jgi:hypothetical protein
MADHLTREELVKAAADAVSLVASGAAHRQVMDPLARDISDAERDGHARLVAALDRLTSPPAPEQSPPGVADVIRFNQQATAGFTFDPDDTARLDYLLNWLARHPIIYEGGTLGHRWGGDTHERRQGLDAARRGAQEEGTDHA